MMERQSIISDLETIESLKIDDVKKMSYHTLLQSLMIIDDIFLHFFCVQNLNLIKDKKIPEYPYPIDKMKYMSVLHDTIVAQMKISDDYEEEILNPDTTMLRCMDILCHYRAQFEERSQKLPSLKKKMQEEGIIH
jgi:hypothetical protein